VPGILCLQLRLSAGKKQKFNFVRKLDYAAMASSCFKLILLNKHSIILHDLYTSVIYSLTGTETEISLQEWNRNRIRIMELEYHWYESFTY